MIVKKFPKDTKQMTEEEYNQLLSKHLDNVLEDFEKSGSEGLEPNEVFQKARKKLKSLDGVVA